MRRCLTLFFAMAMISGCGGDGGGDGGGGESAPPCDPAVDQERCSGSTIRQACSEETSTWTTLDSCPTNYVCEQSGVEANCVYVDPSACETDDDCVDGRCIADRCVPDHCHDGEVSGDEFHIDCGGSCPYGCENGRLCESNEGCLSGCCSPDDLCTTGPGYAPECVCSNPNAEGPMCDECLTGWAGATCELCASNWTGTNCDVCPDNWAGASCDVCANRWTGVGCDSCPDNWTGASCDVCANSWMGEACDVCPDNWGDDCEQPGEGTLGQQCYSDSDCISLECLKSEYGPPFCSRACETPQEPCPAGPDAADGQSLCISFVDLPDPNAAPFIGDIETFCVPRCSLDVQDCIDQNPNWEVCQAPTYLGDPLYPNLGTNNRICQALSFQGKDPVDPLQCNWEKTVGSFANEANMCRKYCSYLETCKVIEDPELGLACCEWGCFNRMVLDGEVNDPWYDEAKCYVDVHYAFGDVGAQNRCNMPPQQCGGEPGDPTPPAAMGASGS